MVRHATFADIETCLGVIRRAHALSPTYQNKPLDVDRARQNLVVRILNPYSLVLINSAGDGMIVGAAGDDLAFPGMKVANEFLFAESEGLTLIREFLRWARRFGEDIEINFCFSFGGVLGERAARILEYFGMQTIGSQMRIL